MFSLDQQLGASVVWLRGGQEGVQGEQNDRHARLPHRRALWRMPRQTSGAAIFFLMLFAIFLLFCSYAIRDDSPMPRYSSVFLWLHHSFNIFAF